jgi:diguanylate cyclase (GGDEF)-like protein
MAFDSQQPIDLRRPDAAAVLEAIGCAVAVLDTDGVIVTTNRSWDDYAGEQGGVGRDYLDSHRARGGVDLDLVLEEGIRRVLAGRSPRFELEYPVDGPTGPRWHLMLASRIDGKPGGAVVAHVDVTAHHDVEEILNARAHRDALTGLPNRRALTERLTHAVQRHHRQGHGVSVVFIDLDGFKQINDDLGHDVGDEVLVAVGRRLAGTIRSADVLGRWGGDEFVVVVDDDSEQVVHSLAARLRGALSDPVVVGGRRTIDVALSMGAARVREGDAPDDVLSRADAAMFQAKRSGQDVVIDPGWSGQNEG